MEIVAPPAFWCVLGFFAARILVVGDRKKISWIIPLHLNYNSDDYRHQQCQSLLIFFSKSHNILRGRLILSLFYL